MKIEGNKPGDGLIEERDNLLAVVEELKAGKSVVEHNLAQEKAKTKELTTEVIQLRTRNTRLEGEREAYADICEKAMDKLLEASR